MELFVFERVSTRPFFLFLALFQNLQWKSTTLPRVDLNNHLLLSKGIILLHKKQSFLFSGTRSDLVQMSYFALARSGWVGSPAVIRSGPQASGLPGLNTLSEWDRIVHF